MELHGAAFPILEAPEVVPGPRERDARSAGAGYLMTCSSTLRFNCMPASVTLLAIIRVFP